MLSNYKKDVFSVLFILSLIILFFSPVLFTNYTFVYRDFSRYFYPLYLFNATTLKDLILPSWNPYLFCGFPNLALIQLGLFYPPSCFLYFFPFDSGIKFFLVFHYLLAGVSTYLLIRKWDLSCYAAIASAITFSLGGYLVSTISLVNTLCSVAWTPLIFYFYSLTTNQKNIYYPILTGLTMSLSLLGGDPVVFYLNTLALFFFTFTRGFGILWGNLCRFALTMLTSVGLILFQLIPFLELTTLSVRAKGLSFGEAVTRSFTPFELIDLIFPFTAWAQRISSNHFFLSLHFGILGVVFCLIAILFVRKRLVAFWGLTLLLAIIFSLGNLLPFYKSLYEYFPLFNLVRYPVKFFSLVAFSAAVLTGLGFDYLLCNLRQKKWRFFCLTAFSTLSCFSCWFFFITVKAPLIQVTAKPYLNFTYSPIMILLILLSMLIIFLFWQRTKLSIGLFSSLIIILMVFNLFFFGININSLIDQRYYHSAPPTVKLLKQTPGIFRFLVEKKIEFDHRFLVGHSMTANFLRMQTDLAGNFGLYWHLYDAHGYEALIMEDQERFFYLLREKRFDDIVHLLSMLNVRFIMADGPIHSSKVKLVKDIELGLEKKVKVYETPSFLPRAFLVPSYRVNKDRKKIFKELFNPEFSPTKEVILEEEGDFVGKDQVVEDRRQAEEVQIKEYYPDQLIIHAFCPKSKFLFLSETFYPGWKAYIDGKEAKIYRANYFFRAIWLEGGEHKVEFVYQPWSFKVGIWASIASFLLLVFGISAKVVESGLKIEEVELRP